MTCFITIHSPLSYFFFFFNDTATTEIYTFPYTTLFRSTKGRAARRRHRRLQHLHGVLPGRQADRRGARQRSEEHTSELQSQSNLVCRLLLEKKKKNKENKDVLNIR